MTGGPRRFPKVCDNCGADFLGRHEESRFCCFPCQVAGNKIQFGRPWKPTADNLKAAHERHKMRKWLESEKEKTCR